MREDHVGELNAIFSDSRTKEFDLYLINGYRDGQAHEEAIAFIFDRHFQGLPETAELAISSNYNVYIDDIKLIYWKSRCDNSDDVSAPFFLHIIPVNEEGPARSSEEVHIR